MTHDEARPRSTTVFTGSLDYASDVSVEGWAFNPTSPEDKVAVSVALDGQEVWSGKADRLRPDLLTAKIGDGRHAFYASLPVTEPRRKLSDSTVRAYITATGADLPKSPLTLTGEKSSSDELVAVVKVPATPPALSHSMQPNHVQRVRGSLDSVTGHQISGWAFDELRPTTPVSIDLFEGQLLLHRVTAQDYRVDLMRAAIGDGHCAFAFPTPITLLDGHPHILRAIVTNTDVELPSSPMTVTLPSGVPTQILAQLRLATFQAMNVFKQIEKVVDAESFNRITRQQTHVSDYQLWVGRFCAFDAETRAAMLKMTLCMEYKPVFSVVMATYNTLRRHLEGAVQSVIDQIYPYWELCIADDASDTETTSLLRSLALEDSRIRVSYREVNGNISEATNTALQMATGDYVCFMDHDDLITIDALFQFALRISKTSPDMLYSDEDKIDSRDVAVEPHFKPDYNYTLLLSYNYICHLFAVRKTVADRVGPLNSLYNGSQDHDFILRCCELIDAKHICHVPLVLYHWRAHENSTAFNIDVKTYALDAGIRAISDHLSRSGSGASVSLGAGNSYRVKWLPPMQLPKVSIIIPTRDRASILAVCLLGLLTKTAYKNFEIIIVDNGSVEHETFDLFEEMKGYSQVRVITYDGTFNYSKICNFGAGRAVGDALLMLNNDVEILEPEWLNEMVGQLVQKNVGAVGAKLLYPDGRVQHAGVILGIGGIAGHAHKFLDQHDGGYMNRAKVVHELSACTAACLLIRREVYVQAGGFNEDQLAVAFNDVDLCLKIRRNGHKIVMTPYATLRHHESLSRGDENTPAKHFRSTKEVSYMLSEWQAVLALDPYYSQNLTLLSEDFAVDPGRGALRSDFRK